MQMVAQRSTSVAKSRVGSIAALAVLVHIHEYANYYAWGRGGGAVAWKRGAITRPKV